jgi:hypothetical protein
MNIKKFLDWVTIYDKVKEYSGFLEEKKANLVAYNLKGEAFS